MSSSPYFINQNRSPLSHFLRATWFTISQHTWELTDLFLYQRQFYATPNNIQNSRHCHRDCNMKYTKFVRLLGPSHPPQFVFVVVALFLIDFSLRSLWTQSMHHPRVMCNLTYITYFLQKMFLNEELSVLVHAGIGTSFLNGLITICKAAILCVISPKELCRVLTA